MAQLLEVATLAQYNTGTSVESAGNTIAFNASSPIGAVGGSMAITMPGGTTGTAYKPYTFTNPGTGILRHVLYADFAGMTFADGDAFVFYYPRGSSFSNRMFILNFRRLNANQFYVDVNIYSEGNVLAWTEFIAVTKALHKIEVEAKRSSASGVADASLRVWVDDVLSVTRNGYIMYTSALPIDRIWVGDVASLDSGSSGLLRVGDIHVYDTEYSSFQPAWASNCNTLVGCPV